MIPILIALIGAAEAALREPERRLVRRLMEDGTEEALRRALGIVSRRTVPVWPVDQSPYRPPGGGVYSAQIWYMHQGRIERTRFLDEVPKGATIVGTIVGALDELQSVGEQFARALTPQFLRVLLLEVDWFERLFAPTSPRVRVRTDCELVVSWLFFALCGQTNGPLLSAGLGGHFIVRRDPGIGFEGRDSFVLRGTVLHGPDGQPIALGQVGELHRSSIVQFVWMISRLLVLQQTPEVGRYMQTTSFPARYPRLHHPTVNLDQSVDWVTGEISPLVMMERTVPGGSIEIDAYPWNQAELEDETTSWRDLYTRGPSISGEPTFRPFGPGVVALYDEYESEARLRDVNQGNMIRRFACRGEVGPYSIPSSSDRPAPAPEISVMHPGSRGPLTPQDSPLRLIPWASYADPERCATAASAAEVFAWDQLAIPAGGFTEAMAIRLCEDHLEDFRQVVDWRDVVALSRTMIGAAPAHGVESLERPVCVVEERVFLRALAEGIPPGIMITAAGTDHPRPSGCAWPVLLEIDGSVRAEVITDGSYRLLDRIPPERLTNAQALAPSPFALAQLEASESGWVMVENDLDWWSLITRQMEWSKRLVLTLRYGVELVHPSTGARARAVLAPPQPAEGIPLAPELRAVGTMQVIDRNNELDVAVVTTPAEMRAAFARIAEKRAP